MRRGLQLWVWSGSLQPLCCPLSPSPLWTPQGTHALARPQEAESQDQAKGEKKGEEGRIAQKKEKSRPRLMQKYCQRVHEMQIFARLFPTFSFFFQTVHQHSIKLFGFASLNFRVPHTCGELSCSLFRKAHDLSLQSSGYPGGKCSLSRRGLLSPGLSRQPL